MGHLGLPLATRRRWDSLEIYCLLSAQRCKVELSEQIGIFGNHRTTQLIWKNASGEGLFLNWLTQYFSELPK